MGEGPSVAELGFRLVGSLALVVGLLFLIARTVNRRYRPATGATVQVLARQQLTRGAGIAVVGVGDRVLVVGTTDQQVSLLAEMEPEDLLEEAPLALLPGADEASVGAVAGDVVAGPRPAPRRTSARHRATPARPLPAPAAAGGALAGSVLSAATWKQTLAFFSGGSAADAATGAGEPQRPAS